MEREYNHNIKAVLNNMAEGARDDYDYLFQKAAQVMRRQGRIIKLEKLTKLHPSIQRLILRLAIAKVKGDTRRITYQHIKELEDLILRRPENSIVDLPLGISCVKKKKSLTFYRRKN